MMAQIQHDHLKNHGSGPECASGDILVLYENVLVCKKVMYYFTD